MKKEIQLQLLAIFVKSHFVAASTFEISQSKIKNNQPSVEGLLSVVLQI